MLTLLNISVSAQKYMMVGKDTLPYKDKIEITYDTTYKDKIAYIKADTSYLEVCPSFEKVHGKIVNVTDSSCLSQGVWINYAANGDYYTGIYKDGKTAGKWRKYDKDGKLLATIYRPFYDNLKDNTPLCVWLGIIWMITFFLRSVSNNNIYNNENGTDFTVIRTSLLPKFQLFEPDELRHLLLCYFTIWFFKYKPVNRANVNISNILSIIVVGLPIILLIGLGLIDRSE